jgi:predicted transglutaminase-like protease
MEKIVSKEKPMKAHDQLIYKSITTDRTNSQLILGRTYTIESVINGKIKVKHKQGLFDPECFTHVATNEYHLTMEDYTIILNALHYYKKVEKRGEFQQYTDERINDVRDMLCYQLCDTPLNNRM